MRLAVGKDTTPYSLHVFVNNIEMISSHKKGDMLIIQTHSFDRDKVSQVKKKRIAVPSFQSWSLVEQTP